MEVRYADITGENSKLLSSRTHICKLCLEYLPLFVLPRRIKVATKFYRWELAALKEEKL